eukprot:gene12052-14100_t
MTGIGFKRIAIIGAMEEEVNQLRQDIQNEQVFQRAGCEIYTGFLDAAGTIQVALLRSGVGKVSAAMCTSILLDYFHPDAVINFGTAGGLATSLAIGDIVVSSEVRYHDADVTAFGYQLGQMAKCPPSFVAAEPLVALAEKITQQLNITYLRGLICTGDIFMNGGENLQRVIHNFPLAIAAEMEAASIGHVCFRYGIPFVVVRAISDTGNHDSTANFKDS